MFGKVLEVTEVAVADQVAAAANLDVVAGGVTKGEGCAAVKARAIQTRIGLEHGGLLVADFLFTSQGDKNQVAAITLTFSSTGVAAGTAKRFQVFKIPADKATMDMKAM